MNPESLNEFTRQWPIRKETADVMKELLGDPNDRAVALIGAAILQTAVRTLIVSRFIQLSNTDYLRLTENDGALSTFSAVIQLGHALGLYGPNTRADFNRIRKIRNAFAHSIRPIQFSTPAIAKICAALHRPTIEPGTELVLENRTG